MADFNKLFSIDTPFARFMNNLADILIIGILTLICCIPVITIGAALTAAYYTIVKCVRKSTGKVFAEYFKCFKNNFLQSLIPCIIFDIAFVVMAINIFYLWGNENKLNDSIFVVSIFVLVLLASVFIYFWPLLSRFPWKNIIILRTSLILSFKYIYVNLGIVLLFIVSLILIFLMPWAILVIPGLFIFTVSFPLEWVVRKLMPPVDPDSEEASKWYYN